ncbi:TonB family protein [Acinetobacter chinensis]|nr:TonB family protein [Acinetobacter chinensis]
MSYSPTPAMQDPNSMKKKVVAALVAVVIGHMGVLWAVSHMKMAELKPIEKKPVQVRFVKIKQDIPPPPPPPVMPKPKPKPVEKKVEPKPVVKPKIISQKVTKPASDVKHQEDIKEKQKQEQQKLDQQRQAEQLRQDQLKREQELREQQAREQAARDKAERDRADRERADRESKTPRVVSFGELDWSRKPVIKYTNEDLKGSNRKMLIALEVDGTSGKINSARIASSSGVSAFDEKILRSVRYSKFRPVKGGGILTTTLPLEFELNTQN